MAIFIHSADWQIGKPFGKVEDPEKNSTLKTSRLKAVKKLKALAEEYKASFLLVSGDTFDSFSPDRSTVSALCGAIGSLDIPVYLIPGNHDHAGPGSVWYQDFFKQEKEELAPNLTVITEKTPIELENAVILPCPLMKNHEATDTTEWLRDLELYASLPSDKPRIVLAHGSVISFSTNSGSEPEMNNSAEQDSNFINLNRLPFDEIDYVALGDWHGTKEINHKVWYSGTIEPDNFIRNETYSSGNILVVQAERGEQPKVTTCSTKVITWSELNFHFNTSESLPVFENQLNDITGNRVASDAMRLSLTGTLGISDAAKLQNIIEKLQARLLLLKLSMATSIAPTEDEIYQLRENQEDPLVSYVAEELIEKLSSADPDESAVASIALRELYSVYRKEAES